VISPMKGRLPDNTQYTQETVINTHSQIRTRNPSKRAATRIVLIRCNSMQVFIYCKITLHVSVIHRTHHQEYIKL